MNFQSAAEFTSGFALCLLLTSIASGVEKDGRIAGSGPRVLCQSCHDGSGGRGWTEQSEGSPGVSGYRPPTPATHRSMAERAFVKTTHVYKTVGDVRVEADVYRPEGAQARPVVVWLHGGALIVGSRSQVPGQILDLCTREQFVLVSFDYRLAPEVKLPEIAADLQDAFRWLLDERPTRFGADPKRMVVTGGSAGGFLTMLSGAIVTPRPSA